jgi:hypothetical protein
MGLLCLDVDRVSGSTVYGCGPVLLEHSVEYGPLAPVWYNS